MNLMDLLVSITADTNGLDTGLSEAESKTDGFESSTNSKFSGLGKKIGKAMIAATAVVATGVGAMTKSAIENYAQYEQLVGGVDTLFGTSSKKVQEYAANAFKTAGMSANQYMETVTSFSASLLQSLDGDTEKAAKKADLAITDMSDNANKMGTSMEMIQNAYQGFAKQNYTMLDNLKLGYGGTKEEMQRLLSDAEKISGIKYDISSYSDIVDAIHVVQTEMGITGTTALEASTTIEGSVNSMKAAWTNLVTGFGDANADLSTLVDNVVQTATQVAVNVAPIALNAFESIGTAAQMIAPKIIEALPNVINTVSNMMLNIVSGITNNLPQLMDAGVQIVLNLVQGISKQLPTLIPQMVKAITTMVTTLVNNGPKFISAAGTLIKALASGIIKSIPIVIKAIPQIISGMIRTLASGISEMSKIGGQLISGLWQGISNKIGWVIDRIKGMGTSIINAVKSVFKINSPSKVFAEIGDYCVQGFEKGFAPLADGTVTTGKYGIDTASIKPMSIGSGSSSGSTADLQTAIYNAMSAALDNHVISFNNRELGRLVKSYV